MVTLAHRHIDSIIHFIEINLLINYFLVISYNDRTHYYSNHHNRLLHHLQIHHHQYSNLLCLGIANFRLHFYLFVKMGPIPLHKNYFFKMIVETSAFVDYFSTGSFSMVEYKAFAFFAIAYFDLQ